MDQITNWMQSNWYEFGTLFAQFAFLIAVIWLGRKILTSLRAAQQQMGALLRLAMTDGLQEGAKASEAAAEPIHEAVDEPTPSAITGSRFSTAPERPASYDAFEKPARTATPSLPGELSGRAKTSEPLASEPVTMAQITSTPDPTPYVAAPLTLPEDENDGGHLAGVVQCLQTPVPKKPKSDSALKKVVRWLQAPAR